MAGVLEAVGAQACAVGQLADREVPERCALGREVSLQEAQVGEDRALARDGARLEPRGRHLDGGTRWESKLHPGIPAMEELDLQELIAIGEPPEPLDHLPADGRVVPGGRHPEGQAERFEIEEEPPAPLRHPLLEQEEEGVKRALIGTGHGRVSPPSRAKRAVGSGRVSGRGGADGGPDPGAWR